MSKAAKFSAAVVGIIFIIGNRSPAGAATFADSNFTEQAVAADLDPTAMDLAPDGRIFICSKGGAVRIVKDGRLLPAPFVQMPVPTVNEQGLLGIAFHPRFADSPYVYLYYTVTAPTHNRVIRFWAGADTAVDEGHHIFDMDNVTATNHMGGAIHFGRDGKLYISSGNSASSENSQSIATNLGKILRVNPDGSVPSDNPFLDQAEGANRAIWATGIRNTFTFAVDPATGRMFGCESGDIAEEVNELLPGKNYGYGQQEGYDLPRHPELMVGEFQAPAYAYTGGCIIAAAFCPPGAQQDFPAAYQHKFFFADHNNGWIKFMDTGDPKSVAVFATGSQNPVDIKFAPDGSMYYLSRARMGGSLMHVTYGSGSALALGRAPRSAGLSASAGTLPFGWRLAMSRMGLLPWIPGAQSADIRSLDGKSLRVSRAAASGAQLILPPSAGDGVYFIRYR